jgi:hypothetical protein
MKPWEQYQMTESDWQEHLRDYAEWCQSQTHKDETMMQQIKRLSQQHDEQKQQEQQQVLERIRLLRRAEREQGERQPKSTV